MLVIKLMNLFIILYFVLKYIFLQKGWDGFVEGKNSFDIVNGFGFVFNK